MAQRTEAKPLTLELRAAYSPWSKSLEVKPRRPERTIRLTDMQGAASLGVLHTIFPNGNKIHIKMEGNGIRLTPHEISLTVNRHAVSAEGYLISAKSGEHTLAISNLLFMAKVS